MTIRDNLKTDVARKTGDTGLPIGSAVPLQTFDNWEGSSISLKDYLSANSCFVFVSVTCLNCVDLLPFLSEIEERWNYRMIVFSTGSREDHEEMADYFNWSFPVIFLDMLEMEKRFQIEYLPFVILTDSSGKVSNKGVIYNADDFGFLVKHLKL